MKESIIGYGFGDGHINRLIYEASQRGALEMFVVSNDERGTLRDKTANWTFAAARS